MTENLQSYNDRGEWPSPGDRARVIRLGTTMGMLVAYKNLDVRMQGVDGTVLNYVPGHGGDVWFMRHDHSGDIGAYAVTELAPLPADADK